MAQIAITALSLPELGATHWIVQACFIASLITGCLSVYYSCAVQLILGGLHGPDETAVWLIYDYLDYRHQARNLEECLPEVVSQIITIPSFNSALILVAPAALLNWSLATFLVGLGLYLGIVYTKQLSTIAGTHASLAVLITYIIFTVGALVAFYVPVGMKVIETTLSRQQSIFDWTASKLDSLQSGRDRTTTVSMPGKEQTSSQISAAAPHGTVTTDTFAGITEDSNDMDDIASALREAIRSEKAHLAAQKRLLLAFEAHANMARERSQE